MPVVGIHQPNYLPWVGYFYKMMRCDIFILLDDAQYTKNGFVNRNRIKTPAGEAFLSIPITARLKDQIDEVRISDRRFAEKHLKTLQACYGRAPFYKLYIDRLAEILRKELGLSALNEALIRQCAQWLDIGCATLRSSALAIDGASDERLALLVKAVRGDVYLSGRGGAKYQHPETFANHGVELRYTDFSPPTYAQLWGDFIPGLSIVDLLFNLGPESGNALRRATGAGRDRPCS
jgi:hypothetical protein